MKNALTGIAVAVLLALGLSACAPAPTGTSPQTSDRPAATAAPSPAPSIRPESTPPAEQDSEPEPTSAFTIAGVEPMAFTATLDPPTLDEVFEIRDLEHGYAADTAVGPRFLLAHATSPGRAPAPGNAWQELQEGDRIEALGSIWLIAERIEAPKNWPTEDEALVDRAFGAGPGTLALITCVPRWEGRATDNLILIAQQEGTR